MDNEKFLESDQEIGINIKNEELIDTNKISDDKEEIANLPPDSYLKRDEFSSERYKIELKNLPKNFGFSQLRKMLRSLDLKFVKINSPGRCTYAFITFIDENAKQEAMKILNGYKYKGHELTAIVC
jgi:tRNA (uracil-5-)-methyltransferase